ncbi:alpha/beta hydrolase [Limosilactobacillus sp. RRLNB_1_1]|uniref:Alpha/beta hydrolase n=1 Tax=Limosilactobacillus albertensis TaxID=2759752 RepID=A0A7W3TR46_9LACO|nr:alpha/beta hydrolase [Limosilactobacillus albertensis]MBB1069031.1 alpha/beta hydrolase [Limosilactobacillus albertensis]MCD7118791.1 alpha/beta hydrolase [Limosilactobacillus albertensis]MCD7128060.1 alpha/beta hydrolase [Limosilactobacillus albertensis]
MNFKTSDGVRINYYVYGTGKPVVLIHGFGGYQQIWCLQIENLIRQGYQVITYDQRNHGASGRDQNLTTIKPLIKDLYELMMFLQVGNPFLIGHSMGAAVIYGFLNFYPDFPVRGVISIDQSPKMLNTAQWHYGYMDVTRASYKLKLREHGNVRETLNGVPAQVISKLAPEKEMFPFVRAENLPLLYDHAKRDWRSTLMNTHVATLLITANQSPYFNGSFADVMRDANPEFITHQAVDQSGHVIMAEQAKKFNEIMDKYLQEH